MKTQFQTFKPQELCSQKLWHLVNGESTTGSLEESQLKAAIAELEQRQSYLNELTDLIEARTVLS